MEINKVVEHCYILDFLNAAIYHTTITEEIEDIDEYFRKLLNMKADYLSVLVTDKELEIEEVEELNLGNKSLFTTDDVRRFKNITDEMVSLYAKKNHDYGNSFEEGCDKIGSGYPLGRLLDKLNRLINCFGKENEMQVNESIEDTLIDLGCYSVMTLSYLRKNINNNSNLNNNEPRH